MDTHTDYGCKRKILLPMMKKWMMTDGSTGKRCMEDEHKGMEETGFNRET